MSIKINIENLIEGESYDRKVLAKMWGYKGTMALERGAVTPKNDNKIILFITKTNFNSMYKYKNEFDGHCLEIDGQINHGNDMRLINSRKKEEKIYLFYRENAGQTFIFHGEFILVKAEYKPLEETSKFTFLKTKSNQ